MDYTVRARVQAGLGVFPFCRTSIPALRPICTLCSGGNAPAVWQLAIYLVARLRRGAGVTLHPLLASMTFTGTALPFFMCIFLHFLLHAESPSYSALISTLRIV